MNTVNELIESLTPEMAQDLKRAIELVPLGKRYL